MRDQLTTPAVVIDLARVVAQRTAKDGGFDLTGRTVDQMRQLLIGMGDPAPAADPSTKNDDAAAEAGGGERRSHSQDAA